MAASSLAFSSRQARTRGLARSQDGRRRSRTRPRTVQTRALGGGPEDESSSKRKFITREEEPEEFWQSKDEREGKSPLQDPLALSILFGMAVPFVILGIGIATGYIETGN
eukprot:jgi/Pico_ML_1/56051/g1647.t2